MKITIEIDTDKGEHQTPEAISLLGGSVLLALLDGDMVGARRAGQDKPATDENLSVDDDDAPAGRVYGEPSEGRKKRTKDEMAIDAEIEKLFNLAKDAGVAGLPKSIPTNEPAEDVLAELHKIEIPEGEPAKDVLAEEEKGFDPGGDEDDEDASDPMDLDEFRGIVVKAAKKLGNETVGKLVAPYKNPGQVPEEERRDLADKLVEAME